MPAKTEVKAALDNSGVPSSPPAPVTTDAIASPVQAAPKPDAMAGALRMVRKALTDEAVAADTAPAPRTAAPSGFSLQHAQAETAGSYTATGAQTAGMTEGGSNLSRATVETLSAMAVQVNRKLSEGNTKFAVELHPADLGKVEVTLTIARDGTTTAHGGKVKASTISDLTLGYRFASVGTTLQLNVTNLTDEKYISTIGSNGFVNNDSAGTAQTILTGAPRQVFFAVKKSF
jgi:hypothetical protein